MDDVRGRFEFELTQNCCGLSNDIRAALTIPSKINDPGLNLHCQNITGCVSYDLLIRCIYLSNSVRSNRVYFKT